MQRRVIVVASMLASAAAAAPAHAEPADTGAGAESAAGDDMDDQSITAMVGGASGGRVTPGGLRLAGRYNYQLSSVDWFEGIAAFTYGSGAAACFRDRMDTLICDHGVADGASLELAAGVRRMFSAQGQFRPFARAALGIALVRFGSDDVTGFAVPLHAGGGVRARVAPSVAVVGEAELLLGFGGFNRGLGVEPQVGLAVTAGAEFRLP